MQCACNVQCTCNVKCTCNMQCTFDVQCTCYVQFTCDVQCICNVQCPKNDHSNFYIFLSDRLATDVRLGLVSQFLNFTFNLPFILPCIVIYFHRKTNQVHQCIKFILLE